MTDYRVYHSTRFDESSRDWDLGFRYSDGSVIHPHYSDLTESQIVKVCKDLLDEEPNLERIFVWCGKNWWGEISR